MWLPLLPALTVSHHVRCWMPSAMNKSVATRPVLTARIVEWIDEVLDALGIERSALVAASKGSWMATHYAMARMERVERLAMVCPAGIVSSFYAKWLGGDAHGQCSPHACEDRGVCRRHDGEDKTEPARTRGGRSCSSSSWG